MAGPLRTALARLAQALGFVHGIGFLFAAYVFVFSPNFLTSLEWRETVWLLAGPGWFLVTFATYWALRTFQTDGSPAASKAPQSWTNYVLQVLGVPVFLWFCSSTLITHGWPMMTAAFAQAPVTFEFIAADRSDTGRGGRFIQIEDHYWLVGGILNPPPEVWNAAEPGRVLVVSGIGNADGVWYDSVEIKPQ